MADLPVGSANTLTRRSTHLLGQKPSGRRPNPKAVVSAMPVVSVKAKARITAIFFMAVPLVSDVDIARTRQGQSVTVITFWSFSTSRGPLNIPVNRTDFVVRFLKDLIRSAGR